MARASTPTLLSLDRYAQLIGLNPAHFNTAANSGAMPYSDCCTDIWFSYDWQFHGRTSREALAYAIADAERDIAEYVGYWPAPQFIAKEMHVYPHHHRPEVRDTGVNPYNYRKAIKARWGRFISAGQRAVDLVGTDTIAYSDEDGDGIDETATVSLATTLTNACEVKVYFAGEGGAQEWEIRPARTKAISGGTFTATFWSWQFIDPDLWEALPDGTDPTPIDFDNAANLVTTADVYREYCDYSEESCQFSWEPDVVELVCSNCGGSGCIACTITVQDGCIHVRDVELSLVVPALGTYDSSQGSWISQTPAVCREPDEVKIWYCAGDVDDRYLANQTCDPLSNWWAQTIAWLATARLERPFCSCDNVVDLVKDLRTDLSATGGPLGYNITLDDLSNPFGPRKGAVLAWRRVSKLAKKIGKVAVI